MLVSATLWIKLICIFRRDTSNEYASTQWMHVMQSSAARSAPRSKEQVLSFSVVEWKKRAAHVTAPDTTWKMFSVIEKLHHRVGQNWIKFLYSNDFPDRATRCIELPSFETTWCAFESVHHSIMMDTNAFYIASSLVDGFTLLSHRLMDTVSSPIN